MKIAFRIIVVLCALALLWNHAATLKKVESKYGDIQTTYELPFPGAQIAGLYNTAYLRVNKPQTAYHKVPQREGTISDLIVLGTPVMLLKDSSCQGDDKCVLPQITCEEDVCKVFYFAYASDAQSVITHWYLMTSGGPIQDASGATVSYLPTVLSYAPDSVTIRWQPMATSMPEWYEFLGLVVALLLFCFPLVPATEK